MPNQDWGKSGTQGGSGSGSASAGDEAPADSSGGSMSELVLYYPMDDDPPGLVVDHAGGQRNASCVPPSCPTPIPDGVVGGAARFDGVTSRAQLVDDPALHTADGFSLAFWIRAADYGVDGPFRSVFSKKLGDEIGNSWEFGLIPIDATQSNFYYSLHDADEASSINVRREDYVGQWVHVACTNGSGMMRLYIDGELAGESEAGPAEFDNGPLFIGSDVDNVDELRPYWGDLDELRLYSRALSADEIAELAAPGGG